MSKTLESLRSRINEINERLALLEPLYTTRENALARIDAYIDNGESALSVDLGGFYLHRRQRTRVFAYGESCSHEDKTQGLDCGPLLATFMREQFRAWLIKEIDEQVSDEWGLPESERNQQETKLLAELFKLECEEESSISTLVANGEEVYRRPDVRFPLVIALNNPEHFAEAIL